MRGEYTMIKDQMIVVKIDKEEMKMVRFLREEYDMNISSFLRKCIKNKHNELKKK